MGGLGRGEEVLVDEDVGWEGGESAAGVGSEHAENTDAKRDQRE